MDVQPEVPVAVVFKIKPETVTDSLKRDVRPGYFMLPEQAGFQTLDTGPELVIQQPGAKIDMNLGDMGDVENGKQTLDGQMGAGFFPGLTPGCGFEGFAQFHETGRESPGTVAGLDGPFTQQDAVFPNGNAPGNDFGVLVMHQATLVAHVAQTFVPIGFAQEQAGATMRAIIHVVKPGNAK
jgi:hypothetical protein